MAWKDFIAKLEVYHKDVKTATFYYFMDCQVNIVEIDEYMRHPSVSISQKNFKIYSVLAQCFLF